MTDNAWKKWTAVRDKWDPNHRIGGFREQSGQIMNTLSFTTNGV